MNTELTNEQLGAIAKLIGMKAENVPAEWMDGFNQKSLDMDAKEAAWQEKVAEYNRLAELGHSDAEIEQIMKAE